MNEQALNTHGFTVRSNELWIEEMPISQIAASFGTPLYIYSVAQLKKAMQAYMTHFKSDAFATRVFYASKAFNVKAVLQLAQKEGLGVDVVSAGELHTALAAGFNPRNILFHGNNKSLQELQMCLQNNVGVIVLDNLMEAALLAKLKQDYPQADPALLLRINPGISAHTHEYVVTGHVDSKFGVSKLDMDEIIQLVKTVKDAGYHFAGFHCHIGSQIFDKQSFVGEVQVMGTFMKEFMDASQIPVHTLDLGGGFASWYTSEDAPIPIEEVCTSILEACQKVKADLDLPLENVWIEPGRSIAGNAGSALYTIGFTKKTPNRQYLFVDGGMNDNIRPALYGSLYSSDLPLKMDQPATTTYCIAGKCCESGDILVQEALLPEAGPQDLLLLYTTGAYGYSMASHYNKLPVPGVVFVDGDKAFWAVRPESLDDLMAREEDLPA